LNRRLNGLLPTSGNVAFSDKHYENPNLNDIISRAQADYYKAAAPPPSVLAKAIAVVKQRGVLLGPPAVLYILKRQRVLGFEICTGWYVTQTATGPQGGYTVGTCKGEAVIPSGGLPTLPPRPPGP
ncbi:MAG: hypothetical protein IAI48_14240, partial [Candidatus Eremiobacteraeota bacterium]|nr:hypothetical protein [Candidatus Eremiobacteraeota bacterium]